MALVVNIEMFDILGSENIHLCTIGDRVALLLWLRHKETDKHILVANTHLSFPHHAWDRMNQMQQMKKLLNGIESFAERHTIKTATRIGTVTPYEINLNYKNKISCTICYIFYSSVLGDFNVESNSPVCDHLRDSGYFSCFEVSPPGNLTLGRFTSESPHPNNQQQYRNSKQPNHHHHPPHSHQHHTALSTNNQGDSSSSHHYYSNINNNIVRSSRGGSIPHDQHADSSTPTPPLSPLDVDLMSPISEHNSVHHLQNSSTTAKFVSHRTHKHEDLGVDHIFIKPGRDEFATTRDIWNLFARDLIPPSAETQKKEEVESVLEENGHTSTLSKEVQESSSSSSSKSKESISGSLREDTPAMGIYVDQSIVYPNEISAADWFEGFSDISDHRPVGSTIIFGRRIG